MINDRKAAAEYLRSIADHADIPDYQQALRLALEDIERVQTLEANNQQTAHAMRQNGFLDLGAFLASYQQIKEDREVLLKILRDQGECELCRHNATPLPCCPEDATAFECERCCHPKTVCCGCNGDNWEWKGAEHG